MIGIKNKTIGPVCRGTQESFFFYVEAGGGGGGGGGG